MKGKVACWSRKSGWQVKPSFRHEKGEIASKGAGRGKMGIEVELRQRSNTGSNRKGDGNGVEAENTSFLFRNIEGIIESVSQNI